MSELLELCGSENLSLVTLQEMITTIGPRVSSQNALCFHKACYNEKVTLGIVQLLYNILPGALRLGDDNGRLPIHWLCCNDGLDDNNSLDILQFMLSIDPTLPREMDGDGYLPIHVAVEDKSSPFAKYLSMRIQNHCR